MSMKRSKALVRRNRDNESDSPIFAKAAVPKWNWKEHVAGQEEDVFVDYDVKQTFKPQTLIRHAKFGKGIVTNVDDSRIEVLFEDGSKKLGHGLTPASH